MEFEYIEKKEQGKFITRYDVHYTMADGNEKVYEMISRDPDITDYDRLQNKEKEDAVAIIMHDETGEKILINREFRMATGRWIYNFPA